MNRRGFLTALAALGAEPLVPRGTAFSFLGGIHRPAWVEVPTVWPIPKIELRGRLILTLSAGTYPVGVMGGSVIVGPAPATLSSKVPDDKEIVAEVYRIEAPSGIDWPFGPRLLQNRAGDYWIAPRPSPSIRG